MKILAQSVDRSYWRRWPSVNRFAGGVVFFLTFFQVYVWWRRP